MEDASASGILEYAKHIIGIQREAKSNICNFGLYILLNRMLCVLSIDEIHLLKNGEIHLLGLAHILANSRTAMDYESTSFFSILIF